MRWLLRPGSADRLIPGFAAAWLGIPLLWPTGAQARSCTDPAAVAQVLHLLTDRLGLNGALALDHIRRIPSDPVTGGPICEAEIDGIRDGPTIFGRKLDMVRYWDEVATAGTEPAIGARLMPRDEASAPAPSAPPTLVDAAHPGN